jgi:hypothetical protein
MPRGGNGEETLEALHDIVKAGKVCYIGASSMHAWQFARALAVSERHGWVRLVSMQNLVNLLYREEERETKPSVRFCSGTRPRCFCRRRLQNRIFPRLQAGDKKVALKALFDARMLMVAS